MEKKKRILFIEDRKVEFDTLEKVFAECSYFELVNKNPITDEESQRYIERDEQYSEIVDVMHREVDKYDLVLCDLTLRDRGENMSKSGTAHYKLSIQVYLEQKDWLLQNGKKFVFVTSHADWHEKDFYEIDGIKASDCFLKKASDDKKRLDCVRFRDGKPACGLDLHRCHPYRCFNECLRRIADGY